MSVELTEAEVLQTIQRLLDWHARSYQPDSPEWEAARELRDKLWDAKGELFGPGAQIRFDVTTSPDRLLT